MSNPIPGYDGSRPEHPYTAECDSCEELREQVATLTKERDEARKCLTELVYAVEEADELHESGVALDWSIMVRARNVPGVITFQGDDGITPTEGAKPCAKN